MQKASETRWVHIAARSDQRVGADVRRDGSEVLVHFSTPSGHASKAAQAELVDALFSLPGVVSSHHMRATLPLGESELILRLGRRCASLQTRAAGSTCVLDAVVVPENETKEH